MNDDVGGRLLLVIPAVVDVNIGDGQILVDGDFANNLTAYLRRFDEVCVMCPCRVPPYTFPSTCTIGDIEGHERLSIEILPLAYREDRYYFNKSRVSKMLEKEIIRSEYILISPHAGFDWSTRATEICISLGKRYNMEADWNLPAVLKQDWDAMSWGLQKFRRFIWKSIFNYKYKRALEYSALSLVQGGDIYHDYKKIGRNVFSVLNVQVTADEHISKQLLEAKIAHVGQQPPHLVYTGRVTDQKGPLQWLDVVTKLRDAGLSFRATWAGDGDRLAEAREIINKRGLVDICEFIGTISRAESHALIAAADIFLFCHMTKESPRCLVEALAFGTPIVGFGSNYSRELVQEEGGGEFVEMGDTEGLSKIVEELINSAEARRRLIAAAAASGAKLERDKAITERIDLMKKYLGARPASHYDQESGMSA